MELICSNSFPRDRYQFFVHRLDLPHRTQDQKHFHTFVTNCPFQLREDVKEMSDIGFRQGLKREQNIGGMITV